MNVLYAPWRDGYVNKMTDQKDKILKDGSPAPCVFCTQFAADDDDKYFIVKRFEHCAVMMNLFPYNIGHVMVLPLVHKPNLTDLTAEIRNEMMEVANLATQVIGTVLNTEGFNLGINLGIAGGGGMPSHLHMHILPRWRGDTNFLEIIGQTRLISSDFEKTFQKLKDGFAKIA